MAARRTGARTRSVATITVALVASLFAVARPAAAASAPTVAFFRGETLAITADPAPVGTLNQMQATVVVAHDPGVTITGMKENPLGATSGSYGPVQGTVRTLSGGGSNYTVVDVAFVPGTGNWPTFSVDNRMYVRQSCIRLNTSAGELPEQCWTYKVASETDTNQSQEVPAVYDNSGTTQGSVFSNGDVNFSVGYTCDDNDGGSGGGGVCDQVKLRLRNVGTNETRALQCGIDTTGTPACETRAGHPIGAFDANDDTHRTFDLSVSGLPRGKWLIEGLFGNENNLFPDSYDYDYAWLGSFSVNPSAPTVSLSGVPSAGSLGRVNSDATVTYTASVSTDTQILDWDLDQNTGNGFEVRERAAMDYSNDSGGTPSLSVGQYTKTIDVSSLGEGASCGARVQVIDSGVLAATDTPASALSRVGGPSTVSCTTNRKPLGADQGPVAAVAGGPAVAIVLANTDGDGDARTCAIVTPPTRGTVNNTTSCSRTYTANSDPGGADSFTYRVLDDHAGVSPTYTVSLDVADGPAKPLAPTIGTAVAGNTSATVNWTAPADNGGPPVTGYVVTPFIGDVPQPVKTFNTTGTAQLITSLNNGTTYTFTVAAVNSAGTGASSEASNAVTPGPTTTVPGAPTIGAVVVGPGQAKVSWLAPASNGGSGLTGYVVTPTTGGVAQAPIGFTSTATTQTITGLTNGSSYTFKVAATNGIGTGAQSAASAPVTPSAWLPFATADAFITQQFKDFADRAPTASERAAWNSALADGSKSAAQLIEELRSGPYWEGTEASVIRLYSAYFKRAPDASGLNFWIRRRRTGDWNLTKISAAFARSSEFKNKYGPLDNDAFMTLVYLNVLDRAPEPSGFAFWVKRLNNGTSRGSVMLSFSDSSEYIRKQANEVKVVTLYLGLLRRTPTQAEYTSQVARLDAIDPVTTITTIEAEILASAAYAARI